MHKGTLSGLKLTRWFLFGAIKTLVVIWIIFGDWSKMSHLSIILKADWKLFHSNLMLNPSCGSSWNGFSFLTITLTIYTTKKQKVSWRPLKMQHGCAQQQQTLFCFTKFSISNTFLVKPAEMWMKCHWIWCRLFFRGKKELDNSKNYCWKIPRSTPIFEKYALTSCESIWKNESGREFVQKWFKSLPNSFSYRKNSWLQISWTTTFFTKKIYFSTFLMDTISWSAIIFVTKYANQICDNSFFLNSLIKFEKSKCLLRYTHFTQFEAKTTHPFAC